MYRKIDGGADLGALNRLKRLVLFTGMGTSLLCGIGVILASLLDAAPIQPPHLYDIILFLSLNMGMMILLWRRPQVFRAIAAIFVGGGFVVFTRALILVPEDSLRPLWLLVLTGTSFLVLGAPVGWISAVCAAIIVSMATLAGVLDISPFSLTTFLLCIAITSSMFHVYDRYAEQSLQSLHAANLALGEAARRDPLTGLLNLSGLRHRLRAEHADHPEDQPMALAFVDVDYFKAINDRFGHASGDMVLHRVADALVNALRPQDMVARIGGEEFAILLPGLDIPHAAAAVDRARVAVAALRIPLAHGTVSVTVSIGVTAWPSRQEGLDRILQRADMAMYAAKADGRNRVRVTS